jgi:serine protease Do
MKIAFNSQRKAFLLIASLILLAGWMGAEAWKDPSPLHAAQTASVPPGAPQSFTDIAKKASPSVVNISTVKVVKGRGSMPFQSPFGPNDPFKDFFDRFFRDQMPRDYKQRSLGTGFIIDRDGYILTNNHVVEGMDEIRVTFSDGKEFNAKIIGRDPKTDIALIRVDPDRALVPLPLGDSDKLEVGEWVVAIGNPFGLGNTVTAGIVSAKYRQIGAGPYDNFIQTDASINPGNSGGPLLNVAGEVIGINSAIFSRSGGNIGIGFAVPVNIAKDLLPQLKKGKVVRGWLGVMIQKITPELKEKLGLKDDKGALVADVPSGSPAEKAGIKRGDVIVSFDGKEIKEMNDLPYLVGSTPVGKGVKVELVRDGRRKTVKVEIGELKETEEKAEAPGEEQSDLGLSLEEVTPEIAREFGLSEAAGLIVVRVDEDSPAAEAGFRPGDILLEIDQKPVKTLAGFQAAVRNLKKGDTVLFLVKRRGATLFLTLKVWG